MEYCANVWDPHKVEDVNTVERVNHRTTRIVYIIYMCQKDDSTTAAVLHNLGWKPLEGRH